MGFEYKTSFIWDKRRHNMGHYNSVRHEFLLLATRGSCPIDSDKLINSVVSIERTSHSRKPDEFYDIIESLYTWGRRLELFQRIPRNGWDGWGYEVAQAAKASGEAIPATSLKYFPMSGSRTGRRESEAVPIHARGAGRS